MTGTSPQATKTRENVAAGASVSREGYEKGQNSGRRATNSTAKVAKMPEIAAVAVLC